MKVIITENYEEMSKKAAEIIIDVVKNNPQAILGLATGSSPIGTYQNMIKDHVENGTSYHKVEVALDKLVFKPGAAGLYYTGVFLFDEVVAENLTSGIALSTAQLSRVCRGCPIAQVLALFPFLAREGDTSHIALARVPGRQ